MRHDGGAATTLHTELLDVCRDPSIDLRNAAARNMLTVFSSLLYNAPGAVPSGVGEVSAARHLPHVRDQRAATTAVSTSVDADLFVFPPRGNTTVRRRGRVVVGEGAAALGARDRGHGLRRHPGAVDVQRAQGRAPGSQGRQVGGVDLL